MAGGSAHQGRAQPYPVPWEGWDSARHSQLAGSEHLKVCPPRVPWLENQFISLTSHSRGKGANAPDM